MPTSASRCQVIANVDGLRAARFKRVADGVVVATSLSPSTHSSDSNPVAVIRESGFMFLGDAEPPCDDFRADPWGRN